MELVQVRIITEDVRGLAAFYAELVGTDVVLNDYYVEVPAGPATVGFSHRRFVACSPNAATIPGGGRVAPSGDVMLDFLVPDVDRELARLERIGVSWVMRPRTQPWRTRAMTFRDPAGVLVNVFSRTDSEAG